MPELDETYVDHKVGDKVQVRTGTQKGQRGIIDKISDRLLEVRLNAGDNVTVPSDSVTNFSLAARKAWKTMRSQP